MGSSNSWRQKMRCKEPHSGQTGRLSLHSGLTAAHWSRFDNYTADNWNVGTNREKAPVIW